jgi:hypothetical protein
MFSPPFCWSGESAAVGGDGEGVAAKTISKCCDPENKHRKKIENIEQIIKIFIKLLLPDNIVFTTSHIRYLGNLVNKFIIYYLNIAFISSLVRFREDSNSDFNLRFLDIIFIQGK